MATYIINNSEGFPIAEIPDGSVDRLSTDLALPGKNAPYGESLNENFVKLLENFASSVQPAQPIKGQLWYNTSTNKLFVYTGNEFEAGSGTFVSGTMPTKMLAGDIWIDSKENQIHYYDGNDLILAGPIFKKSQGISGLATVSVPDTEGESHVIIQLMVAGKLLGIFSGTVIPFTPSYTIAGFSGKIYPGFNPADIVGLKFKAIATRTDALVAPNGNLLGVTDFMSTRENTGSSGTVTIQNSSPLILGVDGQTTVTANETALTISNTVPSQNFKIFVNTGSGIVEGITVNAHQRRVGILQTSPAATLDVPGSVTATGDINVSEIEIPATQTFPFYNTNVVLNKSTLSSTGVAGIRVNRGSAGVATIRYNSTAGYWEHSKDGVVFGRLLNQSSSGLAAVAFTGNFDDLTGDIFSAKSYWDPVAGGIAYLTGNVGVKVSNPQTALSATLIHSNNLFEQAITLTGSIIDATTGATFKKQLNANTTFSVIIPEGVPTGTVCYFELIIVRAASYTVNFWPNIKWAGGALPVLSDNIDILGFYSKDGGATWFGTVVGINFPVLGTPYPPIVGLAVASDTGFSSFDRITKDDTPTIRVTFNQAGPAWSRTVADYTVSVYENGVLKATATILETHIALGYIDVTCPQTTAGSKSYTAVVTSIVGYRSLYSAPVVVTIDLTAPIVTSIKILSAVVVPE